MEARPGRQVPPSCQHQPGTCCVPPCARHCRDVRRGPHPGEPAGCQERQAQVDGPERREKSQCRPDEVRPRDAPRRKNQFCLSESGRLQSEGDSKLITGFHQAIKSISSRKEGRNSVAKTWTQVFRCSWVWQDEGEVEVGRLKTSEREAAGPHVGVGTCLQPAKAVSRGVARRAANQRAGLGAGGGWGEPLARTGVERRPRTQEETQSRVIRSPWGQPGARWGQRN